MFQLEGVIAFLRQLDALGWSTQVVGLALLLACYGLLLFVARRIGRRNIADLKDENDALKKQVAGSNIKRRKLRDKESKLESAVEDLQAQRPEEGLARRKGTRTRQRGACNPALSGAHCNVWSRSSALLRGASYRRRAGG